MSEKALITHFFDRPAHSKNVSLGIGDDAAVITVPPGQELISSIDTLVTGINFPQKTAAEDIGYKAIAVSLSDMAAMGAEPKTALLSLTLPEANESWLSAFSQGLFELIEAHQMQLIGGDLTRGPLSVTTVVNGFVPQRKAILRKGAKPGDAIYVTGMLGDAGLALKSHPDPDCLQKLNRPTPRVDIGIALREIASAAIDVSDGLAADLEKLCECSDVGAQVIVDNIPRNKASIELALTAGDDFELCFTVPPEKQKHLQQLISSASIQKIGNITTQKTVQFVHSNGKILNLRKKGYEHF